MAQQQSINNYYVYLHLRADTGAPFYVGKGKARRAWCEGGRSSLWGRIAKKHGFAVEIIKRDLSECEAFALEVATIASMDGLCNHTAGGDGISGYRHTDSTRQAISAAHTGKPHKPEHIAKRVEKLKGKKRTPEFGAAISARQTGSKASEETKAKMRAAHIGKVMPAEAIAKTAAWHTGKTRSDEARIRMAQASSTKKGVRCVEMAEEFPSLEDAAKWMRANGSPKATRTGIWYSAKGQRTKSYGFTWEYA
jgi:hypothetical protein